VFSYTSCIDNNHSRQLERGDRVSAAHDVDTTQGLHIASGSVGTVAEDRGSDLVVFFDDHDNPTRLDDSDLSRSKAVDETDPTGWMTAAR
jgi:hypothetical protein